MDTENPGHEEDHQEGGSGDGENYIGGLHLLPFYPEDLQGRGNHQLYLLFREKERVTDGERFVYIMNRESERR